MNDKVSDYFNDITVGRLIWIEDKIKEDSDLHSAYHQVGQTRVFFWRVTSPFLESDKQTLPLPSSSPASPFPSLPTGAKKYRQYFLKLEKFFEKLVRT